MTSTDRLLAATVLLWCGLSIPCMAQEEAGRRPTANSQFDQWDADGDGRLTRDELPQRIRGNFHRADANRDGFISRDEDAAFRARGRSQPQRRQGDASRNQPRPPPQGIRVQRDIPYADTDNPRQRLDLYLPTAPDGDEPLPIVVWIHGGAWRAGDKAGGLGNLAALVASGHYAGASLGYRLTDEGRWPMQIHDCKAAIRWIRANAGKYNIDPDRIGVWGSSAGGHLVAMLGASGDVERLEGKLGSYTDVSSRVQAVVDYYGPSDLAAMSEYPSNMDHDGPASPEGRLVGGRVSEKKDVARDASTTTYATDDDPPFLIVHGDADMTVPYNQSERLQAALEAAQVDSLLITVNGAGHGGFRSNELLRRVRLFLDKTLRGRQAAISGQPIAVGQDVEP